MRNNCAKCGQDFEVYKEDREFYDKVSPVFAGKKQALPPPSFCPDCRHQRRVSWRNIESIYRSTCALCKKQSISLYHPESGYTVYCPSCFWSDRWDPLVYGRDFDPARPFFDQWLDLMRSVPVISLINMNTENSEYCNRIYDGRNNYLSFIALFAPENLIHTYYTMSCKDCVDLAFCQKCELCYEVVEGEGCFDCRFGNRIRNCSDSWFLEDCSSCTHCFQCKNLHQKSYCIRNKQCTKEEYERFIKGQKLNGLSAVDRLKKEAREFFLTQPCRASIMTNCENVVGANNHYCRDCYEVYDFYESERMRYCVMGEKSHDTMDCNGFGQAEFCYECINFLGGNHNLFCNDCVGCADMCYSFNCFQNASSCFGCVSVKKKQYCILNKQYTKEEYEALVPKIIEHMKETPYQSPDGSGTGQAGEWGEFFPAAGSPFGYNETSAPLYFLLTREEAKTKGFRWKERDAKDYQPATVQLPDAIADVADALTKEVLACGTCGKNYKIIQQELDFYRRRQVPIPSSCPDCRHMARMQTRNPARLWKRTCAKCSKQIQASYAPERPEIVYCESCYLKEVY